MTLLAAALEYCERGWKVFPLQPEGKVPLISKEDGGHGFHDATKDPDQIREWWAKEPRANIGIRTGIDVDVLDVDGAVGWRSLAFATNEHGCLASSPVAVSGRSDGGGHYYYRSTGDKTRVGFLDHLDYKAGSAYIVAPPSIHPTGTPYAWLLTPDEIPLEPPPAWLLELIYPPPFAAAIQSIPPGNAYARRALESECGRLALAQPGGRNHALNVAAFSLGQLVGGGALNAEEVAAALVIVALRIELPELEARRTIASGLRAGLRSPRKVPS